MLCGNWLVIRSGLVSLSTSEFEDQCTIFILKGNLFLPMCIKLLNGDFF